MCNHYKGRDEEILGLDLNDNAIEVCTYILNAKEIRHAMHDADNLNALIPYMIHG